MGTCEARACAAVKPSHGICKEPFEQSEGFQGTNRHRKTDIHRHDFRRRAAGPQASMYSEELITAQVNADDLFAAERES